MTELLHIVDELENRFPGKKFTSDGHLLGSMGEVLAEYYYQIKPYRNSAKTHDGEVDGKRVQVKITQGDSVDINDVPDYLLVLFLNKKDGSVYEVYNGPCGWLRDCKVLNKKFDNVRQRDVWQITMNMESVREEEKEETAMARAIRLSGIKI